MDPRQDTLIVADLHSKLELQHIYLKSCRCLPKSAVLRASEFWAKAFRRTFPNHHMISRGLAKIWLGEILDEKKIPWAQGSRGASRLMAYLDQFYPVFCQQDTDVMDEWFEKNPDAQIRWRSWFELAREAWEFFVRQKTFTEKWCLGPLLTAEALPEPQVRRLTFDLGPHLLPVEAELIKRLAQTYDVDVVVPSPRWKTQIHALDSYNLLTEQKKPGDESMEIKVDVRKFTTAAAEVKDAIAQVRVWLDEGASFNEIAIVAPDIESYWPVLSAYMQVEGVPVCKAQVAKLHTLPAVAQWLAQLKLRLSQINTPNLKRALFSSISSEPPVPYDEFTFAFTHIYDDLDLDRDPRVRRVLPSRNFPHGAIRFTTFLETAMGADEVGPEVFSVIEKLYQEIPEKLTLSPKAWINLIEEASARIDVRLSDGAAEGIQVASLSSAEWIDSKYVWFINASEPDLLSAESTAVQSSELSSLTKDLGFLLARGDKLEFELHWQLSRPRARAVISVAESNFAGEAQAPSLLWMSLAFQNGTEVNKVTLPQATRWDEIQQYDETSRLAEPIQKPFGTDSELRLSASAIENYEDCPFIFAAQKIFHLRDSPLLDVDADPMTKGRVTHALLEALTVEPMKFVFSDGELEAILDQIFANLDFKEVHGGFPAALRNRLKTLARRFLEFEKDWRRRFPETRTLGREVPIRAVWNPELKTLRPYGEPGIPFRGQIDRIDTDEKGHAILIDYKSSPYGLTNASSWGNNRSRQLALYTIAAETEGVLPVPITQVDGAIYYVTKTLERKKGFKLETHAGNLVSLEEDRSSILSVEQKEELLNATREDVAKVVESMRNGDFTPNPKKTELCVDCHWRRLCRAKHLN